MVTTLAVDVVKRSGRRPTESFDADKLLASIRAACLSVRSPEGQAEDAAHGVAQAVIVWIENKPAVTSADIRRLTSAHLQRYHPEAAYFYQHHRSII
jgi:transcriptional regulator NrdR family protein